MSNAHPADPTTVPRYEVVVTRHGDEVHREPCESLTAAAEVVAAWEGDEGVRCSVVDLLHGSSADQEVDDLLRMRDDDVTLGDAADDGLEGIDDDLGAAFDEEP